MTASAVPSIIRLTVYVFAERRTKGQRPDHLSLTSTTACGRPTECPIEPPPAEPPPADQAADQVADQAADQASELAGQPPSSAASEDRASDCLSVMTDDDANLESNPEFTLDDDDEDLMLEVTNVGDDVEIIEVLEPSEPVPMVDCCLQVSAPSSL